MSTDWTTFLQNGLSSAIDGHFTKEAAKHANEARPEQNPPVVVQPISAPQVIEGAAKQNNINMGGVQMNKTMVYVAGGALLAAVLLKALK